MYFPKKKDVLSAISKELDYILELLVEKGSVFSRITLIEVLNEIKHTNILRTSFGYETFVNSLIELEVLEKVKFVLPNHLTTSRYVLIMGTQTTVHPFEVALSLLPNSYLSHYSALFLNDLTNNVPKEIFINREQTKKPVDPENILTQKKIDYAFNRPMRKTNQIAIFQYQGREYLVHMLNGKQTGNLGVISKKTPQISRKIRVTNLERTLIDCVVRPSYSGGPEEIMSAFERAAEDISVNRLIGYLKKLDYKYPYQNPIAFYMMENDYKSNSLKLIQDQVDHEFIMYVGYQILNKKHHLQTNVYYPKNLLPGE